MRIVISGIPIDVQKKNIKNMHLQVKPPDGHVVISAPLSVDDKAIEAYARTQLGFIKRAIAQFQDQPRASKRQYVSGETMYIWGKQYFLVFKPDNQKNSFEIQNQNIILSMSAKSTVKQRDAYVKEEYRKILKEEIEKRLPKWESQTGLKCDSWQTKYMVTKWGACSTDKKKLWFNLQLAQKPYACLDYIILHELTHLITRKHDATFIAHMDRYMPNWREIRKELNDSRLDYYEAQDESPLQKLIDQSRYDDIRDAAIAYIQEEHSGDAKRLSVIDMEIENVIHIEQLEDGVIAFDVIASCDVEMPSASRKGYFNERWLKIHCQVTLGIDMSGFRIMSVGNCEPQEESDNDRLSGELVPIISREQFEDEAEKFLTRYCPEALEKPMRVPIETIASDMKLQVIEDIPLSDDLTYFGTIIFDNGNVLDKHRKITIRNAKRGTVYLDPRVSYERSVGTKRTTLAHECFHWHRHQPYHVLMKMIGADDNLGKAIQCQIAANSMDSDKWKAVDWMEWQAKGVAPRILMPAKSTRLKADQLLAVYGGADDASIAAYENVIDELAELFDVSRQAAKVRLMDLGYSKAEGAYPFVDGQYVRGYSFEAGALDKNQTFTIPYADLFKAYCFDREFKKLIDSGQFIFADRHLVLNNEKYIARDQSGSATLSEYANEHGRSSNIAKQKAAGRTYYDVHIGANGYHLFFSIPYGKRIKMGIYTYNVDTYNRLKELKDQIETEFGENLNWEYSKSTGTTRSIVIEEKADVFNPAEQQKIFDWIIDHFDRITTALSMAGERLNISGDSSETRFEIRKRYWTYALAKIHEAHGNPGSFSNVNPSTDNWINGFFGIGGFYLCCVANFDSARSEVVFARAERSENKAAFDALYQHKSEIESKLGTELQWNRGDDIKSSKVFIQLDNVSIENEDDWPQMAKFHAEWSKKFYDLIVPYITVDWQ